MEHQRRLNNTDVHQLRSYGTQVPLVVLLVPQSFLSFSVLYPSRCLSIGLWWSVRCYEGQLYQRDVSARRTLWLFNGTAITPACCNHSQLAARARYHCSQHYTNSGLIGFDWEFFWVFVRYEGVMIDDRNLKHALIQFGKCMWAPCLYKLECVRMGLWEDILPQLTIRQPTAF